MNSIKNILTLVIAIIAFTACEDQLDLVPVTDKGASTFYSNEAEMESAITGVYAQLQNGGLYGLDLIGVGEISGRGFLRGDCCKRRWPFWSVG